MKSDGFLSSCIKVESQRISRQATIPRQVCFELNPDIIDKIEEIKAEYGNLYLKPEQLTDLRYYSLINSPIINTQHIYSDRSSLIFSSNYLSNYSQVPTTVVRSTIDLDGQISQEIQQDLWQNPQLSLKVIQAHHWLTAEILRQLPLENKRQTSLIFWILWGIHAIAFSLAIFIFLPAFFWLKIIVNIVVLYLLKVSLRHLIKHKFRTLILSQLASGWLSNKTSKRQLGFKLLSLLA